MLTPECQVSSADYQAYRPAWKAKTVIAGTYPVLESVNIIITTIIIIITIFLLCLLLYQALICNHRNVKCSGVRVDSWIERGTTISPHYDSLLAKLMVFAPDRPAAVKKMSAALAETQVGSLQALLSPGALLSSQYDQTLSFVSHLYVCVIHSCIASDLWGVRQYTKPGLNPGPGSQKTHTLSHFTNLPHHTHVFTCPIAVCAG